MIENNSHTDLNRFFITEKYTTWLCVILWLPSRDYGSEAWLQWSVYSFTVTWFQKCQGCPLDCPGPDFHSCWLMSCFRLSWIRSCFVCNPLPSACTVGPWKSTTLFTVARVSLTPFCVTRRPRQQCQRPCLIRRLWQLKPHWWNQQKDFFTNT